MNRLGTILVPMLAGFLVTVAVVSWHSGWWQHRKALDSPVAAPPSVEVRPPNLRIVPVHLTAAAPATVAAAAAPSAPVGAAPAAEPVPVSESDDPPPVPRANAGDSPDLEAPVRKFARGGRANPE